MMMMMIYCFGHLFAEGNHLFDSLRVLVGTHATWSKTGTHALQVRIGVI